MCHQPTHGKQIFIKFSNQFLYGASDLFANKRFSLLVNILWKIVIIDKNGALEWRAIIELYLISLSPNLGSRYLSYINQIQKEKH